MKIFLVLALALVLALPSWMAKTVTPVGWGSSVAYELWLAYNAALIIGIYCTTRNIFNVWGAVLLTGLGLGLFGVYTGITPISVSLADLGLGLLCGVLVYAAVTAAQVCLLKGGCRGRIGIDRQGREDRKHPDGGLRPGVAGSGAGSDRLVEYG